MYCARSTSVVPLCPVGAEWGNDDTTCAVCTWTMLADSDMSPVYTHPPLSIVYTCDVLPAGEAPSQGLEEAWQVSKSHSTQCRGWVVLWSGSEQ